MADKKHSTDRTIRQLILNNVISILEKPRVNAYTPQALVEIVYALLSVCFDRKSFEKKMFDNYSGNKPWWLSEDLDYSIATQRLKKLVLSLQDTIDSKPSTHNKE